MLALHLALRWLRRRRMSWLAMGAVAVTVWISVVVLGVMQGWIDYTRRQVRAAESDFTVRIPGVAIPEDAGIDVILASLPGVAAVGPYVQTPAPLSQGRLRHDGKRMIPVLVDGIDWAADEALGRLPPQWLHLEPSIDLSAPALPPDERGTGFLSPGYRGWLTQAGLELMAPLAGFPLPPPPRPQLPWRPGLVLGRELLYEQGGRLWLGDEVEISLPDGRGGLIGRVRLEISDTLATGIIEIDRLAALIPLAQAQELTGLDARRDRDGIGRVDGYRLRLQPGHAQDDFRRSVAADPRLEGLGLELRSWQERRGNVVRLLEVNRRNLAMVMLFIQGLCIFTIAAVFSTLVAEKRHDIGVLLGLGVERHRIAVAFLLAALVACLVGGLLGWGLGWGSMALINPISELFGTPLFPQEVLYTPEAPTSYDPLVPLFFCAVMAVVGLLSALWPAWRAARTDPAQTLREAG